MRSISVLLLAGALVCGSAAAGPLATDFDNCWHDGQGTPWCGSVNVSSGQGLTATIDYAVYRWWKYPGSDYVPPADTFVYAYQVYVTGANPTEVVYWNVPMLPSNEAQAIDDDTGLGQAGGVVPVDALIDAGKQAAWWKWDPALLTHSDGLVFSSVNMPRGDLIGYVENHGQYAFGIVPSPADDIPEPATLGLMAVGLLALLRRRR